MRPYTPPTGRCTATNAAPPARPPIRRRSGDDVGQQLAFELRDLILQQQLALLHPLQPELVERRPLRQSSDHVVEIAMLAAQLLELAAQILLALHPRPIGSDP